MDAKITARLTPLIKMYNKLASADFKNEEVADEVKRTIVGMGLFSIPMLETLLSMARRAKEDILMTDIPTLLAEYGLKKATLEDGTEVYNEKILEVSVKDLDKDLLIKWIIEEGYESTIKDTLSFGKGSYDEMLEEFLNKNGYSYERDSGIHPQTLKKTIKEHLELGETLTKEEKAERNWSFPPAEAVRVEIKERAAVKPPKEGGSF